MLRSRLLVAIFLGVFVPVLAVPPALAAPTAVPGTRVMIDPPPGFVPSARFPGFQRADAGASIMVTELPGSAVEMRKAMTRESLATRGMSLLASQTVMVGGSEALLLNVSQVANGIDFLKWMLVTGDAQYTVTVVGTFPATAAEELGAPVREAVLSAMWDSKAQNDPWAGLLFRISPGARLKFAKRIGNSLLITETSTPGQAGPDEPVYVAATSVSDSTIGDLQEFSERRAVAVAQIRNVRSIRGRAIHLDSLDAYELLADADDAKTGVPVRLYQTIAKDEEGYFIFVGLVSAKRGESIVEEFRHITSTFKRVRAGK